VDNGEDGYDGGGGDDAPTEVKVWPYDALVLDSALRSTVSSRSIRAKLAMPWKQRRQDDMPVSMESVRHLN
jgi:hypothetical protein